MIYTWLESFKKGWLEKDIDLVLSLFTEDVEYWETPFQKIEGSDQLRIEWEAIRAQSYIELDLSVYNSQSNKHAVLWTLSYINSSDEPQNWAGTYLLELNDLGKCVYFYQTGENSPEE